MSRTALLIMDVQVGFIEGEMCVKDAKLILERIQTLIQNARAADVLVIYVQHNSDPEVDGEIHPSIEPEKEEPVILKMEADAFYETNLKAVLEKLDINHLIMAGFQTEVCINATAQKAQKLGYKVTIVENAHSTFDAEEAAEAIIARYSQSFKTFASVIRADDLVFKASD